jgi:hypothetical protein
MDAQLFLTKFRRALPRDWDTLYNELATLYPGLGRPQVIADGKWTAYITHVLHKVARRADLGCCCRSTEHPSSLKKMTKQNGERHEYIYDFTWYRTWHSYELPAVIIEHENKLDINEFMADFWKLMFGYAPLRIMICYTMADQWQWYIDTIHYYAREANWHYPGNVEDLVLIGRYYMMDPRQYRVIYRQPRTHTFCDIGWLDQAIAHFRQEPVA